MTKIAILFLLLSFACLALVMARAIWLSSDAKLRERQALELERAQLAKDVEATRHELAGYEARIIDLTERRRARQAGKPR